MLTRQTTFFITYSFLAFFTAIGSAFSQNTAYVLVEIAPPGVFVDIKDYSANKAGQLAWCGETVSGEFGIWEGSESEGYQPVATSSAGSDSSFGRSPDINSQGDVIWQSRTDNPYVVEVCVHFGDDRFDQESMKYIGTDQSFLNQSITNLGTTPRIADAPSGLPIAIGRAFFSGQHGIWSYDGTIRRLTPTTGSNLHDNLSDPVLSTGGLWRGVASQRVPREQYVFIWRDGQPEQEAAGPYPRVTTSSITNQGVVAAIVRTVDGTDLLITTSQSSGTTNVIAQTGDVWLSFDSDGPGINRPGINGLSETVFLGTKDGGDQYLEHSSEGTIIQTGMELLNRGTIIGLDFHPEGFEGDNIAFEADFADGTTGLYLARPPVTITLGDVNLDGNVNFLDISPFISVLSSGMFQAEADINQDGEVNFLDISPFISILSDS